MLIRNWNDEVEYITIEISTNTARVRCVTGYGPQEADCISRKEKFWNYLDQEVHSAREENIGLVIAINSNAWAGDAIIPNDPNNQNYNEKLLEGFLKRNKNMTLVNALPICEGLVTRKRITKCLNEKSALDIFLVCDNILPFVTGMHVDERSEHQVTNFYGKKCRGRVTETDHAMVQLHVSLKFEIQKPQRIEAYNYKSDEYRKYFKDITTDAIKFSQYFNSDEGFQTQIKKWEHTLKTI